VDALGDARAPSSRGVKSNAPTARAHVVAIARRALVRARSLAWWLDVAAVAAVVRAVAVIARPLTYSPLAYDEKFYVYGGYSLLHGQVPYRDFQTLKGPMMSLTEALAVALFGLDHEAFRLLPLWMGVGAIAALVAALIQRGVLRLVAIAIGLLVASIWLDPSHHETSVNDSESFLLAFFALALACFLIRARSSAPWSFLGGVFLGATVLSKENFVITAAATWVVFVFLPRSQAPRGARASYVRWSLAGGIGLGLVTAAYLAASGGLGPYLHVIRAYPKFAKSYCVTLGCFRPGPFWDERQQEWQHLGEHLLNFATIGPWLPLLAATIVLAKRDTLWFVVASAATFCATLVTISIGHCYWNHYFVLGATGLAVFALPGAEALSVALRRARRRVRAWAGLATLAGIACASYPQYAQALEKQPAPVEREVAADVKEAIDRYTNRWDPILTTGTPDLYYLTRRLGTHETNGFVDELLVLYAGDTDAERVSGMRARLEAARPKLVVVDSSWSAYPQRSARTLNALVDAYLAAHHYVQRGRVYVRPDLIGPANDAPLKPATSDVTFDGK
jgi:hypothetical protein